MVYKKINLIGTSKKDFTGAVKAAVDAAAKTVRGIRWVEVSSLGAKVEKNKVVEYQADVKVVFEIER